jgi:hypothetical protein
MDANERRFHVTYNGNEVIRLGKSGVFQAGTSAWVAEEDARAAAKMSGFVVEGLDGAPAPKPAPAQEAKPAEQAKKKEDLDKTGAGAKKAEAAAPAKVDDKGDKTEKTETKPDKSSDNIEIKKA